MELRRASETDIPALLEMIRDFFAWENIPFDAGRIEPALRTLIGRPELGQAWLFEVAQEAVGYGIVTFGFDLEFAGRDAILTDLYLKPACRDRGLGERALDLLVTHTRQAGAHALHLLVDPENKRAFRLYERCGFEQSHRRAMTRRLD